MSGSQLGEVMNGLDTVIHSQRIARVSFLNPTYSSIVPTLLTTQADYSIMTTAIG
jgi:hypothetical protein